MTAQRPTRIVDSRGARTSELKNWFYAQAMRTPCVRCCCCCTMGWCARVSFKYYTHSRIYICATHVRYNKSRQSLWLGAVANDITNITRVQAKDRMCTRYMNLYIKLSSRTTQLLFGGGGCAGHAYVYMGVRLEYPGAE